MISCIRLAGLQGGVERRLAGLDTCGSSGLPRLAKRICPTILLSENPSNRPILGYDPDWPPNERFPGKAALCMGVLNRRAVALSTCAFLLTDQDLKHNLHLA